jgi:spore maturation protein CgeB
MKVLYLPIGTQTGTANAFKKFFETYIFDFLSSRDPNSEFLQIASKFKPDWIHMQLQMTEAISPNTILQIRNKFPNIKISNWTGDIRKQPNKYFINISNVVDYSLMSNVGQINLYKNNGCKNIRYWQIGYDPNNFYSIDNKNFKYYVSFVGNSYGNIFPDGSLRTSIVKKIKQTYGNFAGIFGGGYSNKQIPVCNVEEANSIYNNSICVFSMNNFNDVEHYFSDRLLMCLASGRPTIIYRFPKWDSYFVDRGDVLIAENTEHVISLVEECRNNPDWATQIGRNGYLKARSEHSFESRILELANIVCSS